MLWDEPKIFFLERRYFFSIILSEFLKNRVALQLFFVQIGQFYRRVKRDFFLVHHSEQFRDKVRQAYKTLDLIATFA